MIERTSSASQPRLLVAYGERSVPALQLVEAASGVCDLLWLVDAGASEMAKTSRFLKKVGTVVDIAGLSPKEAAEAVRPHAPQGMVTYYDTDMVKLAVIAQELGLRFHKPLVAERLVDKQVQREALRAGGMSVPRCWSLPADEDQDVTALANEIDFPAVLKPRQGSGSRHTFHLRDANDLVAHWAELSAAPGGRDEMVVEEYIPDGWSRHREQFADYVSVESVVDAGRVNHLAVTGRFRLAPPFREAGFFIPSDLLEEDTYVVLDVATAAVQALGVDVGCVHTEIKMTPDGPRVIEVNGRIGGGVPEMLRLAAGVPMLELSIRLALGEPVALDQLVVCERVGYRFLVQPPSSASRVKKIEGLDKLAALPGVQDIYVHHGPGEAVNWRDGSRAYVFSVTGSVSDYEELQALDRFLHETVHIHYEPSGG